MHYTKLLLVALFAIWISGCGWERKVVFKSSSAKDSVEIQQPFPTNGWGVRLQLRSSARTKTLYQLRGDVFLDFADVTWSPGDKKLAVFTCGTPPIRLAYNVADTAEVPFQQMEPTVVAHIRALYHLESQVNSKDVFDWACSSEGRAAFLKLHPNAAPR